jgi:transmembrane sensor
MSSNPKRRPVHPLDWARAAGLEELVEEKLNLHLKIRRRNHIYVTIIFGAITSFCITALIYYNSKPAVNYNHHTYTVISEPARSVLPDGSIMIRKDDAECKVVYTTSQRRIILNKGEAYFQVAKNPSRPFIVVVSDIEFRAVGTAFTVERSTNQVQLLVTEGHVLVEEPADKLISSDAQHDITNSNSIYKHLGNVGAGNKLVVHLNAQNRQIPQIQTVPAKELMQNTTWRAPLLEFSDTPLSEVLSAFNSYSSTHIYLADQNLSNLRLGGRMRANNITVLLSLLESYYGIKSANKDDGIILYKINQQM